MRAEDAVDLPEEDFRRTRRYLAPWVFALPAGLEATTYPPPSDLVGEQEWSGVVDLATDVALKTSSYEGSRLTRLCQLESEWIFSMPPVGGSPFMEEPALLAGEEFDALVFNALHGWYRQALSCLRNALETLAVAAALAAANDSRTFASWRRGRQISFGRSRRLLRDSDVGRCVDVDAAPQSIFGDGPDAWLKARYGRLCSYAHGQAGYSNADFWMSNGPIFVRSALALVEAEFRETLALSYLLLRIGWPGYSVSSGAQSLLDGDHEPWARFDGVLRAWILSPA
jgi:hypothetical protein